MAEPRTIRKKSMRDIDAQRKRIEDRMRDAYYQAEQIESNSERRAELARLNNRMRYVNGIADVYQNNIRQTPEYQSGMTAWGQTLRGGGGREARKAIVDEIVSRRYSRSVYARRNNR